MGVEIKLTDRDFPVSPAFIDFLHGYIAGKVSTVTWHDQQSEQLVPARFDEVVGHAVAVAEEVLQHPIGHRAIYRSFELLTAFLTGRSDKLRSLHERHRFICVVGCPRHGGTYLVKQLFHALQIDPARVPNVLAHDGFPDAAPFRFEQGYNAFTALMHQMAEYLAMVEVYYADSRRENDLIVVPKKATKAAYQGAFFTAAFGPSTEYLITLRHPVPACISTYEKSTGLPSDGRFSVRSNIEEWAQRDTMFTRGDAYQPLSEDYFLVYLRYWEQYHCNLVLTGLLAHPNRRWMVYGAESMNAVVQEWCRRFGADQSPEEFRISDYGGRHREWNKQAEAGIRRVAAAWKTAGVAFPLEEVMEAY